MANFHLLNVASYSSAAHLFISLNDHLGVLAILHGEMPGEVCVDDPASPHSALLRHGQRFYLTGKARNTIFNQAVRAYFLDVVIPETRANGNDSYILYYSPDDWQPSLEAILVGQHPIPARHYFYQRASALQDWQPSVPTGFSLRWVDKKLLAEPALHNLDSLEEELLSEAPSVDYFLTHRFGVCGIYNNSIAGFCTSENDLDERCELGINTLEPYQRKGLATTLTLCMIDQAYQRGVRQIGWHCFASNQPSIVTAQKTGFERIREYPSYYSFVDPIRS